MRTILRFVRPVLLLSLVCTVIPALPAQLSLGQQLVLETRKEAFGPDVQNGIVIFSLDPRELTPMWLPAARGDREFHWPVSSVGIAFGHEDFARIHPMERNPAGIFYLVLPQDQLPAAPEPVTYRFMVAGNLYSDPRNPDLMEVEGGGGVLASRIVLKPRPQRLASPVIVGLRSDGTAEVTLQLIAGPLVRSVRVAGSFNSWDPTGFVLSPVPDNPQTRAITLVLPPGRYFYQFVVDGEWIADPLNGSGATGPMLRPASVLEIPRDS